MIRTTMLAIVAVLALQPQDSSADHISEQQAIEAFQALEARVAALEPTCVPEPPDLIHWWPGDGNADDVVGGNDGALMNGATFTVGKVGQAFLFDGSDDFVALPGTFGGGPEATIEAWVKSTGLTLDFQAIVSSTESEFVHLQLHTEGNIGFYKSPPGTSSFVNLPIIFPSPLIGYRHIAMSIKSGETRLFINGLKVGSSDTEFNFILSTSDLRIGSGFGGIRFFQGEIDEVGIFDRALTAAEIQAIHNAGSAGKC